MIYKGENIPYPSVTKISFGKVLEALEKQVHDDDPNVSVFAKNLLTESENYPELREGIASENFNKDLPIVKKLSRILFPDVLLTNEIKGIIPPFEFAPFYTSSRFRSILEASGEDFSFELTDYTLDQLYILGCASILSMYYKYQFPLGLTRLVNITNKKLDKVLTYRMAMNGELMEASPGPNAKEITPDDYQELIDNFDNIALWKEKFPQDSWVVKGIGIVNLMDITVDHTISSIVSNLLTKTDGVEGKIEEGIRKLFNIKDLGVGFLMYKNKTLTRPFMEGVPTILCSELENVDALQGLCESSYHVLFRKGQPLIISDVARFDKNSPSLLTKELLRQGVGSYVIAPIRNDGVFLGFLELASHTKHELNGASLKRLDAVLPILAVSINRLMVEMQDRREAIIQQECTTIHPSVKWRFEEEANKFMARESRHERPTFGDIVFKNIYPLYGQLDIKGSTGKRNQAITADLTLQLNEVKKVLEVICQSTKMPIYEEMMIRVDGYRKQLGNELLSGSEYRILRFLEDEIHPTLNQIKKRDRVITTSVDRYMALLDPEMHSIYDQRQKYDQHVNVINQSLASYLDEKQVDAQRMFPHYFERYKTDGVEYNMYVGESIAKDHDFDPVFLENLQLWQLMVTCELERKYKEIQLEMDSDIEIASLILVYSNPLSVHFRMDEKRFDVEGAYNARYEIVKKRIDKALIKGTSERITVPGKIAIVYTNDHEAVTYDRYISFLEKKGYLKKNSKEVLELDSVQGIYGLKAVRVQINFENGMQKDASFDVKGMVDVIGSEN